MFFAVVVACGASVDDIVVDVDEVVVVASVVDEVVEAVVVEVDSVDDVVDDIVLVVS